MKLFFAKKENALDWCHFFSKLSILLIAILLSSNASAFSFPSSLSTTGSSRTFTITFSCPSGKDYCYLQEKSGSSWENVQYKLGQETVRKSLTRNVGTHTFRIRSCYVTGTRYGTYSTCGNGDSKSIRIYKKPSSSPDTKINGTKNAFSKTGTFTITWDKPQNSTHVVFYKKDPGDTSFISIGSSSASSGGSITYTKTDGEYSYRVKACNSGACAPQGEEATVVVLKAPDRPSLNVTSDHPSDGKIRISIIGEDQDEVDYYLWTLYRNGSAINGGSTSNGYLSEEDLSEGNYKYKVYACKGGPSSSCSSSVTSSEMNVDAPDRPNGLRSEAVDFDGDFAVSWDRKNNTRAYTLQQLEPHAGATWKNVSPTRTSALSIPVNVDESGTYRYRLRGHNNVGDSPYSSSISVKVALPPKQSPSISGYPQGPSNGIFSISWKLYDDGDASLYKLHRISPSGSLKVYETAEKELNISVKDAGTWRFKVQACNPEGGNDNCAAPGPTVNVSVEAPSDTPSIRSGHNNNGSNLKIEWNGVSHASAYNVQYKKPGASSWSTVTNSSGNALAIGATYYEPNFSLVNGRYYFRVRAINRIGNTYYSSAHYVDVAFSPDPPGSVNVASIGAGGVFNVSWPDSKDRTTEYRLQRRKAGQSWVTLTLASPSTRSHTDPVPSEGTYEYRVSGCNKVGSHRNCSSAWRTSVKVTAYVPQGAPIWDDAEPLQSESNSFTLRWSSLSNADEYYLQIFDEAADQWVDIDRGSENVNRTEQPVSVGSMGVYRFRVRAENRLGSNGTYSAEKVVYVVAKPNDVTNFSAGAGAGENSGKVKLSWENVVNHNDNYTDYEIEVKRNNEGFDHLVLADDDESSPHYYSGPNGSGLDGAVYRFRARACNKVAQSEESCSDKWNVQPPPVYKPKGTFDWTVPPNSASSGYQVEWVFSTERTGQEAETFRLKRSPAWSDGPIRETTSPFSEVVDQSGVYTYSVQACNDFGCSSFSSNEATVKVALKPDVPDWVSSSGDTNGIFTLEWNASNRHVEYYKVRERYSDVSVDRTITVDSGTTLDRSLDDAGTYRYQLSACSKTADFESCATNNTELEMSVAAPAAVGNVQVPSSAVAGSTFIVKWVNVDTATSYTVWEYEGADRRKVAEEIPGLTLGASGEEGRYRYGVQACSRIGCAEETLSPFVQVITRPEQPTDITAPNPNDGTYTISWAESTNATAYHVSVQNSGSDWEVSDEMVSPSYPVEGLEEGSYTHHLKACRTVNEKTVCSPLWNSQVYSVQAPENAPVFVSAPSVSYTSSVELSWDPVQNTREYHVEYRLKGSSGSWAMIKSDVPAATVESLKQGVYEFQVTSWNYQGKSAPSLTVETEVKLRPSGPTDFSAHPNYTTGKSLLEWSESDVTPKAEFYEVRERKAGETWSAVKEYDAAGLADWHEAVSEPGIRRYSVRGCRGEGDSKHCSDWIESNDVDYTAPTSPSLNVPYFSDDGVYSVTWSEVEKASRYEVTENLAAIETDFLSVHYSIENPKSAGLYTYRAKACNVVGCSPDSPSRTVVVQTFTLAFPEDSGGDGGDSGSGSSGGSGDESETPYGANVLESGDLSAAPGAAADGVAVGAIPGEFRVSESGAATYSIPLAILKGTAGVSPQLSLNYSSQNGNGLLGQGWALGGLSAITRCRQTLAQDGEANPISWSEEDRFCLDGQRLMVVSGSYGAPGAEYKTEIDQFKTIKAHGGTSGNPDYFTVTGKDGSVSTFGSGGDVSKLTSGEFTYQWSIDKFADSVGNHIVFLYENSNGNNVRIRTINYAFPSVGSTSDGDASIVFSYREEGNPSPAYSYVGGAAFKQSSLIEEIQINNRGNEVRRYEFEYDNASYETKVPLLESMELCSEYTCLPATTISWNRPEWPTLSDATYRLQIDNLLTYQLLDINADGRKDIVWLRDDGSWAGGDFRKVRIGYAVANSAGRFVEQTFPIDRSWSVRPDDLDDISLKAIDFNVDGREDIVVYLSGDEGYIYLATPNEDGSWRLEFPESSNNIVGELPPEIYGEVNFVDITSNGLVDAFHVVDEKLEVYRLKATNTDDDNSPYSFIYDGSYNLDVDGSPVCSYDGDGSGPWKIIGVGANGQAGDFNGDGRVDVVVEMSRERVEIRDDPQYSGPGRYVYTCFANAVFTGSDQGFQYFDTLEEAATTLPGGEQYDEWDPEINLADINGDGVTDVIIDRKVRLSTGAEFDTKQDLELLEIQGEESERQVQLADVNRDGYPDVVWQEDVNLNGRVIVYPWISGAEKFGSHIALYSIMSGGSKSYSALDLNGSGTVNLLEISSGDTTEIRSLFDSNETHQPAPSVSAIDNGMGDIVEIDYGSTLQRDGHYSSVWGVNTVSESSEHCIYRYDRHGYPTSHEICRDEVTYETDVAALYESIRDPFAYMPDGQVAEEYSLNHPIVEPTFPLFVVTDVERTAPVAGDNPGSVDGSATNHMSYAYHHFRVQAAGRGSLGFQKLTRINHQTGIRTETTYRQDWPFVGRPLKTVTITEEGVVLSEAANDWSVNKETATDGTAYYQPFIQESVEKGYELNGNGAAQGALLKEVKTTTDQDEYGNVTNVTSVTSAGSDSITQTTSHDYGQVEEDLRFGRVKSTSSEIESSDGRSSSRKSEFTYYEVGNQKNLLKTEKVAVGTDAELTKTHHYDDWGNKTHTVSEGADGKSRTSEKAVFFEGRYVEKKVNTKGHVLYEVIQRDTFGNVTQAQDIHENLIQKRYDVLGREYQTQDDTGAWSWTGRKLCNDGIDCPSGAIYRIENRVSGGGKSFSYYDARQRPIRESSIGFDGTMVHTDTEYDHAGRPKRVSTPYFAGGIPAGWIETEYDLKGRAVEITDPEGDVGQTIAYDGFTKTMVNALGQQKIEISDFQGQLKEVEDHEKGSIAYEYDLYGNLKKATTDAPDTSGAGPVSVRICYDALGRKVGMNDPDKGGFQGGSELSCTDVQDKTNPEGWWKYSYNSLGDLVAKVDPKGQVTEYQYDLLGRKTRQTEWASMDTDATQVRSMKWVYDENLSGSTDSGELGQLTYVMQADGELPSECDETVYCEVYAYDGYGRGLGSVTFMPGGEVANMTSVEYDSIGRPFVEKDVAHLNSGVHHRYNSYGFRTTTYDLYTGDLLQKTVDMDARGNVLEEWRSDNGLLSTQYTYDPYFGRLKTQITTGGVTANPIQDLEYSWDNLGNLEYRVNRGAKSNTQTRNMSEGFCYDGLNRLVKATQGNISPACGPNLSDADVEYDGFGNITRKRGVGDYTYGYEGDGTPVAGPHAVIQAGNSTYEYDGNGNQTSGGGRREIRYTVFDKAYEIETDGGHTTRFAYGPGNTRYKRVDIPDQGPAKTTYYLGNVERIETAGSGTITWRRTVAGTVHIIETDRDYVRADSIDKKVLFTEHLGSTDVITDTVGGIEQSMSFDAWGQRRAPDDWTEVIDSVELESFDTSITQRGFTGHEQLDEAGLVHMGGRLYDPKLGRFLQADPFIQAADNTQSYNRYSYVWNNPLNATDPSGFFLDKLWDEIKPFVGAIVAIAASIICPACAAPVIGMISGAAQAAANGGNIIKGAVFGAFAGAAYEAGSLFASGLVGGVQAYVEGGDFGRGFLAAGVGAFMGAQDIQGGWGFTASAVTGGVVSEITGGKFKNGAATAAFTWALSQGAQKAHDLLGKGSPSNAQRNFSVENKGWDLKVEDGVLTGELTYGCGVTDTSGCHAAAEQILTINESEKVNISLSWVEKNADITFQTLDRIHFGVGGERTLARHIPLKNRWLGFGGPRSRIQVLNGYQNNQGVILHEFGHAIGAPHQYNDTNSVMSYSEKARTNFSSDEIDAIIDAYR